MDERARRIGANEILFREVNERIDGLNETFGALSGTMAAVCECGDVSCIEQLVLTPAEYERVRADPTMFVLVPGHENPSVEYVVEAHGAYNVIRKRDGGPAELAAANHPR